MLVKGQDHDEFGEAVAIMFVVCVYRAGLALMNAVLMRQADRITKSCTTELFRRYWFIVDQTKRFQPSL